MMTDKQTDKVLSMFYDEISDMSWEEWCGTSSSDKERIVPDVMFRLNDLTLDIDEVYDLFWEWVEGLDEECFKNDFDEEDEV